MIAWFLAMTIVGPPPPGGGPVVPRVRSITPSSDTLPANTLKFYLTFSKPMARGLAYDHVRLWDEDADREVDGAFLELGEELWDARQERLTLLLDPARIKQGLLSRDEDGPAVRDGGRYRLVIDKEWVDAEGVPLGVERVQRFAVGPPDVTSPEPAGWDLERPTAGTRDALTVRSPEPLDAALFRRQVTILDAAGAMVAGTATVDDEERRWQFRPERPWEAGSYRLRARDPLEDRAGNRIGRLFEVDLTEPHAERPGTVDRPFVIEPK